VVEQALPQATMPAVAPTAALPNQPNAYWDLGGTASTWAGPLAAVTVKLFTTNTGSPTPYETTTTASDGTYMFGYLDGTFYVGFFPPSGSGYSPVYYQQAASLAYATGVNIPEYYERNDVGVYFNRPGGITGKVTASDGGAALPGVEVDLYDKSSGNLLKSDTTGANGQYTFVDLGPGAYVVGFAPDPSGPYLPQYYNNKATKALANGVTVATTVAPNINAVLQHKPNGGISGKVTAWNGGAAIQNVTVSVYDKSSGNLKESVSTGNDGKYIFNYLNPGTYVVGFSPDIFSSYIGQFYNNKPTQDAADGITVASSVVTGINAVLLQTGTITGKVTDANGGAALGNISVEVWVESGCNMSSPYSDTTNAQGIYTIAGIPPGKYPMSFEPVDPSSPYLSELYNNKSSFDNADLVTVTSGGTTTINTSLSKGGAISGKVTAADTTKPLQGIVVYVIEKKSGHNIGGATTNAQGLYTTSALPGGTYNLYFMPESVPYIPEYYNKKSTLSDATDVTVVTPNTTININAALAKGGVISGNVSAADTAKPLQNVYVGFFDKNGIYVGSADPDSSGNYSSTGLPPGATRVYFEIQNYGDAAKYVSQYYSNKTSLALATPVNVTGTSQVSGINAVLAKGGSISGQVVTLDKGAPVDGASIDVYDSTNTVVNSNSTDSSGDYQVAGLPAGNYRVHFYYNDCQNNYSEDYYNKKASLALADPVAVTAPNDTGNIKGYLHLLGKIYLPLIRK